MKILGSFVLLIALFQFSFIFSTLLLKKQKCIRRKSLTSNGLAHNKKNLVFLHLNKLYSFVLDRLAYLFTKRNESTSPT